MKEREANQQFRTVTDKVQRKQDFYSGACMASIKNLLLPTQTITQPKIDATDRRQSEAQNEDKSLTTKETLDDIKRIHQKEKKKQEENNMNMYHPGTTSEGGVIKIFICQKYAFNFLN